MKLLEIYLFEDDDQSKYRALEQLLRNEKVMLIPMIVNPPMFPGEEEWDYYKKNIDPILDRTGWKRVDEHLPIFNEKHWIFKQRESTSVYKASNVSDPLKSIREMMMKLDPKSQASFALLKDIEEVKKIVQEVKNDVKKVADLFWNEPINIGIPGVHSVMNRQKKSGDFERVLKKRKHLKGRLGRTRYMGDPKGSDWKKSF